MSSKLSLWHIDENLRRAVEKMHNSVDENGEIDDSAIAEFEECEAALERKQEAVLLYVKSQRPYIEQIKTEIKRLERLKIAVENNEKRIIKVVKNQFIHYGTKKLETINLTATLKESTAVDVYDFEKLDGRFKREKTTYEPDKTAIREALKNGEVVEGAALVKNITINLQ